MSRHTGFTLIEALAATALAAIMMTAVMSVVSAIAHSDHSTNTNHEQKAWRKQVLEVIQCDLRHSDTVETIDGCVVLTGHTSLDRKTLNPTHRPAVVKYAVTEHAGHSWLIRTQTDPDNRALDNSWTQVVCSGVRSISITTSPSSSADNSHGRTNPDDPDVDTTELPLISVPQQTAILTLAWTTPDTPEASYTPIIDDTSTTVLIH